MEIYIIKKLDHNDFIEIKKWFKDPEMVRRVEYPTQKWFNYISGTATVYAYSVFLNEKLIGFIQMDTEGDIGHILMAINPDCKNKGHGRNILKQFLSKNKFPNISNIEAHIETDNITSIKCFLAAGFSPKKNNKCTEEGFEVLVAKL